MAVSDAEIAAKQAELDAATKEYNEADHQMVIYSEKYKVAALSYRTAHPNAARPSPSDLAHVCPEYGFTLADYEAYDKARHKKMLIGGKQVECKWALDALKEKQQNEKNRYEEKKQRSQQTLKESTEDPQNTRKIPNYSHDIIAKGRAVGRDGKVHEHTVTIKDNLTGSTRVVDTETMEIIDVHRVSKEERHKLWKDLDEKEKQKQQNTSSVKSADVKNKTHQRSQTPISTAPETPAQKKQREAEERKRKEEQKAAEAKQKAEQKAADKARRQQEHEKRVEERKQNQKEYDDALAKYKKDRADQKAKEKAEREEAAKKRHDEYVKQLDAKSKEGEESGKGAYKKINDYTYSEKTKYEEQIKNGGYQGSSAQAKKELKDSLSDIWNMSTGDARKEIAGAYNDVSGSVDTLRNARGTIQDLVKGKIMGDGLGAFKNSALTIGQAAAAVRDKQGMVDLQKVILTQKLADRMVLDQISDAVHGQMLNFKDAGTDVRNALLVQKAYVSAYLKQTFGNPQFMRNVTGVVAVKVGNYVEALTSEKVAQYEKKIDDKIDSTFTKVDQKIDSVTDKITTKLDDLSKLDILSKMNKALDKMNPLSGLQSKLDKFSNSPVGKLLKPLMKNVSKLGGSIRGMINKTGIGKTINKVRDKILNLQKGVQKAKEWVKKKAQMVKNYVNQLKKKAKAVVKAFADKVVGEIRSKIQNIASSAFGGKGLKF